MIYIAFCGVQNGDGDVLFKKIQYIQLNLVIMKLKRPNKLCHYKQVSF